MCEELALKSQSQAATAASESEGFDVIEWHADFTNLPRDAKQWVIDAQLERITRLQTFLDTQDDVTPPLTWIRMT